MTGTVRVVKRALKAFQKDQNLGLLGPHNLTWQYGQANLKEFVAFELAPFGFDSDAEREIEITWSVLQSKLGQERLEKKSWRIVATGCAMDSLLGRTRSCPWRPNF